MTTATLKKLKTTPRLRTTLLETGMPAESSNLTFELIDGISDSNYDWFVNGIQKFESPNTNFYLGNGIQMDFYGDELYFFEDTDNTNGNNFEFYKYFDGDVYFHIVILEVSSGVVTKVRIDIFNDNGGTLEYQIIFVLQNYKYFSRLDMYTKRGPDFTGGFDNGFEFYIGDDSSFSIPYDKTIESILQTGAVGNNDSSQDGGSLYLNDGDIENVVVNLRRNLLHALYVPTPNYIPGFSIFDLVETVGVEKKSNLTALWIGLGVLFLVVVIILVVYMTKKSAAAMRPLPLPMPMPRY